MFSFFTHAACYFASMLTGVFVCALCVARAKTPADDT